MAAPCGTWHCVCGPVRKCGVTRPFNRIVNCRPPHIDGYTNNSGAVAVRCRNRLHLARYISIIRSSPNEVGSGGGGCHTCHWPRVLAVLEHAASPTGEGLGRALPGPACAITKAPAVVSIFLSSAHHHPCVWGCRCASHLPKRSNEVRLTANHTLEADRGASWSHRARRGTVCAGRCEMAVCSAAQRDR